MSVPPLEDSDLAWVLAACAEAKNAVPILIQQIINAGVTILCDTAKIFSLFVKNCRPFKWPFYAHCSHRTHLATPLKKS